MRLLLFVALFLSATSVLWAADSQIGTPELDLLRKFFMGNYGIALGLGAAVLGLWRIVMKDIGGGITLIIAGVLITLLPALYDGVQFIVCPIANALSGGTACTS